MLEKMQEAEDNKTKKETIKKYVETLDTFIEADTETSKDEKIKVEIIK